MCGGILPSSPLALHGLAVGVEPHKHELLPVLPLR